MNEEIKATKAPPSFSKYAQAMETPSGSRLVHVSGQVGIDLEGHLPAEAADEHRLAWRHVFAVLEAADMQKEDIVDVLAIVKDHDQVPIYRKVRDEMLDGHVCASTMLVCSLANPEWKVEIAVTAAKTK